MKRKAGNPFQAAVLAVGVLFTLTASSYGVMYLQHLRPPGEQPSPAGRWLLETLDAHGEVLLAAELLLLATAILAAVLWDRRKKPPPRGRNP